MSSKEKENTENQNKVPMNAAQCKEKLLQMLIQFDRFCHENDLKCYLAWGGDLVRSSQASWFYSLGC